MPADDPYAALPPLTDEERDLANRLRRHVEVLAGKIGPRHIGAPDRLGKARAYISEQFSRAGYEPGEQTFVARGIEVANIEGALWGAGEANAGVVVGAHYDTVPGSPGADDNASGVALLLELARQLQTRPLRTTVFWVAFVNEEPPYFQTEEMGSLVYARSCRARGRRISAMLSLECVGYFTDEPGSQRYPAPFGLFYPSVGNFIGFVTNMRNRRLLQRVLRAFRRAATVPAEGGAVPAFVPGVGWSDHWAFWQEGYPALMVTDTAPFRNPHYHGRDDLPETLDYERMARLVSGMTAVIRDLAGGYADRSPA